MHFRPVEQSMDDQYLGQGGGGGPDHAAAPETVAVASSGSGGVYFSLDDVFGPESEPVSTPGEDSAQATADGNVAAVVTSLDRPESPRHPSDMRRLETEHTTAGYREGISVAKERTVQAGFDEGFSLGATIGLAAGRLLGTLEGINDALKNRLNDQAGGEDEETTATATATATATSELLKEVREELNVVKIFSSDYWAPDGNWSYDVKPDGDDEVLFPDVAKAHPLIRKWTAIVDEQVRLWKIDRSVLDGEDGDARMEATVDDAATTGTNAIPLPPPASKQPLDW